uniref:snRNA-activating protein complex subunit 4 n=1 Tax=Panagrolaimus davidi TaxID=227884 RepID=A0A914QHY4_9BILA
MDRNHDFDNFFGSDDDDEHEAELIDAIQVTNYPPNYQRSAVELRGLPSHNNGASNNVENDYIELDDVEYDSEGEEEDDDEDDEFEEELIVDDELRQLAKDTSHVSEYDLAALIAYNASYLEIIESLIAKTDRALDENRDAQEEIHERLSNKEEDQRPYTVTVGLYTKPYFKDKYGMPPPMNSETLELTKNHQLTTLIKDDHMWKQDELRRLRRGVREQLMRQMNLRLESRKALVEEKIKNYNATNTEIELDLWRQEIETLQRKIVYNSTKSDAEIFTGDYSKISWQEISIKFFNGLRSPKACEMKWLNEERPEINKSPWTPEEDEKLREISTLALSNWSFISHELGTKRSEFQCFCRLKEIELKIFHERVIWTNEEDDKLVSIVYAFNNLESIPWEKIAKLMGNRQASDCRKRFQYSLQSSIHMGRWTYAEDMFLLDAINRYGPYEWERIASCVPGRSAPQCRSRFNNVLTVNRNVQQYTFEEDEIILTCVKLFGRGKWSEICQLLSHRYPTDVRSRFKSFLNRKIKNLEPYDEINYRNSIWNQFSKRQDILIRFQAYEASGPEKPDENVAKRFGIGDFIINSKFGEIQPISSVVEEKKSKFGNIHIYSSGILRKRPSSVEEYRAHRFHKLYNTVPENIRNKLDEFLSELDERRKNREIEYEKASKGDLLEELEKKFRQEDIERVKKLMDEAIIVTQSDIELVNRQRLPRIRIRRDYRKRRGKKLKAVDITKLTQVKTEEDFRQKCEIVREMHLTPQIADYLKIPLEKIYRKDGTRRRISELVLMEDINSQKYWITERDATIFNIILNLNKHLITKSMYMYEKKFRHTSTKRSADFLRNELMFTEVPSVYEKSKEESPPLEAYVKLISNVLQPCRGTLTALHQYRIRGRELCTSMASQYFDPLDENGYPEAYTQFTNQRLDIELPNRIKNSVDYLLLRARMFKMFFLPMLLQYGQSTKEAQQKIREEIYLRNLRRSRERIFEETNDPNLGVSVFDDDALIIGRVSTVAEKEMPQICKRLVSQSNHIDDSIDSLLTKVSQTPSTSKRRGRPKKDPIDEKLLAWKKPSIPVTLQLPSMNNGNNESVETSMMDSQPSTSSAATPSTSTPTSAPKKRGRKRKAEIFERINDPTSMQNSITSLVESSVARSSPPSKSLNPLDDIEVVALRPEAAQDKRTLSEIGAYQPRWVKKKRQEINREQTDGELTLADLLFVRGKKTRALTGLYNQQHSQMIYESIQPWLQDSEAQNAGEEQKEEEEMNEDEQVLQRIKNEMG